MPTSQDRLVSAAEANRGFSALLRRVREGAVFVVTSHGRPVARLSPYDDETGRRVAARKRLIARLRRQKPIDIGPWTRDELYDV